MCDRENFSARQLYRKIKSTEKFMFARNSKSDTFKYLSPSTADRCWRELIVSSQREHPFSALMEEPAPVKFPSPRQTMYHSTYSFPRRKFDERLRATGAIPPAGRASFYREYLRPELVDLAKDAKYQALLAKHHRDSLDGGAPSVPGSSRSVRSSASRSSMASSIRVRC